MEDNKADKLLDRWWDYNKNDIAYGAELSMQRATKYSNKSKQNYYQAYFDKRKLIKKL